MKIRLRYNLHKSKSSLNSKGEFKRELEKSLLTRYDELYGKPSFWRQYVLARATRVFVTSAVGVSMLGTSAYAYNSPEVTEGSVLYPIKIGIEKIEETTKVSTESKVKFIIKKAERREAEKKVLVAKIEPENHSRGRGNSVFETVSSTLPVVQVTSTLEIATSTVTSTEVEIEKEIERETEKNKNKENSKSRTNFVNRIKKNTDQKQVIVEVKKTEVHIEELDHELENVKEQLGDDEGSRKIKELIEDRLEKAREKYREKIEKEENKKIILPVPASSTEKIRNTRASNRRSQRQVNIPAIVTKPPVVTSTPEILPVTTTENIIPASTTVKIDDHQGVSDRSREKEEDERD